MFYANENGLPLSSPSNWVVSDATSRPFTPLTDRCARRRFSKCSITPMSIFCHALNVSQLQIALSSARVGSYQSLIGGGKVDAAIGAYTWGLELNAAFSPLLSMVEVVLRNRLHETASTIFNKPDWYQDVLKNNGDHLWQRTLHNNPSIVQSFYRKGHPPHDKRHVWINGHRKSLKHWRSPAESKFEEIVSRLKNSGKLVTPDQIVAHAMFGFWLILLGPSFESTTDPLALWPNCTTGTFSNNANMDRASAYAALDRIKSLRNRISHHEPVWRMARPLTPAGVNATLGACIQEMHDLLISMEPECVGLLKNAGILSRLSWLIDPRTIAAFAGSQSASSVDLRSIARSVRKLTKSSHRTQITTPLPSPSKAIDIQYAGKTVLAILPYA